MWTEKKVLQLSRPLCIILPPPPLLRDPPPQFDALSKCFCLCLISSFCQNIFCCTLQVCCRSFDVLSVIESNTILMAQTPHPPLTHTFLVIMGRKHDRESLRVRQSCWLSSSAVCFLCASVGARRVSPPDRPPFPLIKSSKIFHLSVSGPWRSVAACSQACLLTVSLSNLHQTVAAASACPRRSSGSWSSTFFQKKCNGRFWASQWHKQYPKARQFSGVRGLSLHTQTFREFSTKCWLSPHLPPPWRGHHSGLGLSCVWSNPISSQCLSRSRAGMVQRMEISISPLSFSLSLLHSQPFLSTLSPERRRSGWKGGHRALSAQL